MNQIQSSILQSTGISLVDEMGKYPGHYTQTFNLKFDNRWTSNIYPTINRKNFLYKNPKIEKYNIEPNQVIENYNLYNLTQYGVIINNTGGYISEIGSTTINSF